MEKLCTVEEAIKPLLLSVFIGLDLEVLKKTTEDKEGHEITDAKLTRRITALPVRSRKEKQNQVSQDS